MIDIAAEHALAARRASGKRSLLVGVVLTIVAPFVLVASFWLVSAQRDHVLASALLLALGGGALLSGPWHVLRGLAQLRGAAKALRALEDGRLPRATLRR